MKQMTTRLVVLILCLIGMTAVLASCGKNEKEPEPTPAPTEAVTSTPEATPTAEATPTTEATPTPEATPKPEATPTPEPTPTEGPSEKELWYNALIEDSLMSEGNNARLKSVIEKARSGEDVYVATIGGSITEGAGAKKYENCYAYSFGAAFAERYGKDGGSNVHFINAGLSGTPSTLGVIRYSRDVIEKNEGHQPDLLIIEFAVNDADDPTNGQTYEGIVRRALEADNQPAVILLFSVFKSKWNLQDRLKPIGTYYNLPMVSIRDAVVPRLTDKSLKEADYFDDEYHPTAYGHRIMRDCLLYLIDQVDQKTEVDEPAAMPEKALLGDGFDMVTMIDAQSEGYELTAGGFNQTDKGVFAVRYETGNTFPNNWKHTADSGSDPFTLKLKCRTLLLTYKKSSGAAFGEVEILVDGQVVRKINGHESGGWNNPYTLVLVNNAEAAEHTLTVRMAEGSEDKEFTILAIGYGE